MTEQLPKRPFPIQMKIDGKWYALSKWGHERYDGPLPKKLVEQKRARYQQVRIIRKKSIKGWAIYVRLPK